MVRNDPFVRIRLEFTGKVPRWMNQVLYWNPPVVTLRSDAIFVGRPHHVGILVGAYSTGDSDHFRPDKKVMLLSIHAPRWMGGPEISFIFDDFNAPWGNIPYTRGSSSVLLSRFHNWFLTGWIWPFFDNDIPNGYSQWMFPYDFQRFTKDPKMC